jgi:hypothetical protein
MQESSSTWTATPAYAIDNLGVNDARARIAMTCDDRYMPFLDKPVRSKNFGEPQ